jgi:hypothetical protein
MVGLRVLVVVDYSILHLCNNMGLNNIHFENFQLLSMHHWLERDLGSRGLVQWFGVRGGVLWELVKFLAIVDLF